jgi:hypothetical protein
MGNEPCNLATDELILGSRDARRNYNGKPAQVRSGFTSGGARHADRVLSGSSEDHFDRCRLIPADLEPVLSVED